MNLKTNGMLTGLLCFDKIEAVSFIFLALLLLTSFFGSITSSMILSIESPIDLEYRLLFTLMLDDFGPNDTDFHEKRPFGFFTGAQAFQIFFNH